MSLRMRVSRILNLLRTMPRPLVLWPSMTRLTIIAAALCLLFAAPATAAVPRDWLGVAVDGPLIESAGDHAGEWPMIAGSGARSARIAFLWHEGQPLGPGAVDFSAYDAPVLAAAQHGLGVLPVVVSTPPWARADAGDAAAPPRDVADYAAFLTALVGRYGPRGTLWDEHPELEARPIRAWQIWNEPNLRSYWSRQPFAKGYVRLLKAARAALRAADPGARAILAGLPNGWDALRKIYRAGGRRHFDAAAVHPYTANALRVPRFVREVRRVMRRFGDRRKPVWVTEISWPAAKGRARDPIGIATDDRGQARRLRRGLLALAASRRQLRVRRVYWYTWLSAESSTSVFAWSGLRRLHDGEVVSTPALRAFRATARRLRRGR
jgi:Glycosyl hydrolase catalytic core